MRPLSLTVEGFTCFAERQPPLDFRRLHLFAIAGPTGAGKSSILDAMMFALYGYVPRLGKAGADLITTGRDRLAVELEFAVGQRTFRVARTLRRRQGAKVVLEETTSGRVRPLSDKVTDANAAIERLVGIGYDGFSQSVVLPQGRFDTFLRGAGGDRRELLKGLLGLERYELMRKAAAERRAALDRQIAAAEQVLATLAHATSERLEAARREVAAAECEAARAAERARAVDEEVDGLRQRRQLTIELDAKQCELARLDARAEEIAAAGARVRASQRALPVVPALDAADAAAQRLARSTRERDEAAAAQRRAAETEASAAGAHARALADAAEAASLRARVDALNRIHGPLVRLRGLTAQRPALEALVKQREREAAGARTACDRARESQRQAVEARERAHRAADAIGYDAPLHDLLQPLASEAVRAADLDARLGALRAARDERAAEVTAAARLAARADAAAMRAARTLAAASAAGEAARRALDDARSEQMAGVLRRGLCEGEACPVCERAIEHLPAERPMPQVDALAAACADAVQAVDRARASHQQREAGAVAARTRAAERRTSLERHDADLASVTAQCVAADARIRLALAGAGRAVHSGLEVQADVSAVSLRHWVSSECTRLDTLRRQADAAREALADADRRAQTAAAEGVAADHALAAADEALARIRGDAAANEHERNVLAAEIAAVTASEDPDAERLALEARVGALERRLQGAEQALLAAKVAHGSVRATLAAAAARAEADRRESDHLRDATDTAIRAAGFETASALRAAVLSAAVLQALQREIGEHDEQRQAAVSRLRELQERLAGAAVTADTLRAAEDDCQRCRRAHTEAVAHAAGMRAEARQLEAEVAKADEARAGVERHRRAFDVADVLARELGGDRFQQYLLEDTLEQLVRGASVRLRELSGRYTLEWREDRFHVVDHDNARERRIADTLSGGETFLASLALALELSEQIQRSAGAVRIDSLFIDEGFGTLDADTRSVVAEAIEALQVGGRMVGIITHLEELTDRLPGCVRIAKRSGQGSAWSIERDA